jgi:hypothetical protein
MDREWERRGRRRGERLRRRGGGDLLGGLLKRLGGGDLSKFPQKKKRRILKIGI